MGWHASPDTQSACPCTKNSQLWCKMTKFVHAHKLIVGDIQPYEECYSISKNRLDAPKASLVNSDHIHMCFKHLSEAI